MTTTTNYQMTLLEVGQKEKEVTINDNFAKLDRVPKYLGDLTTDPTVDPTITSSVDLSTVPVGSTYYNTTSSKVRIIRAKTPSVIWSNVA